MSILVAPENLRRLVESLAAILGPDFVDRQLTTSRPDGLNEFERRRLDLKAHPMARQWTNLLSDVERIEASRSLRLSQDSLYLLDLLDALETIKPRRGFQRILDDIRIASQYHSAAYELRILSQFVTAGATIEIVEEGQNKSCDFRLHSAANGSFVGVECKSLQDTTFEEHLVWESALQPLSQCLSRHGRNWRLRVIARAAADQQMVKEICAEVTRIAQGDMIGYHDIAQGRASVECVVLAPSGEEFEGGIRHDSSSDIVDIVCRVRRKGGRYLYSDPKVVDIQPFEPEDQSRSILNGLNKAGDQLARDGPNIVYFQVPHKKGARLQSVIDNAYEPIADTMRRNHGRINLCVVTGQYPTQILRDRDSPLAWIHAVIPNDQANHRLPSDIVPVGTLDLGLDLSANEGAISAEFSFDSPWSSQIGRSIFNHCSRDGHYQLRVWHSLNGRFRVDVRTPKLGRLSASGHPSFQEREIHKLAVTWSKNGLTMYVDGAEVQ